MSGWSLPQVDAGGLARRRLPVGGVHARRVLPPIGAARRDRDRGAGDSGRRLLIAQPTDRAVGAFARGRFSLPVRRRRNFDATSADGSLWLQSHPLPIARLIFSLERNHVGSLVERDTPTSRRDANYKTRLPDDFLRANIKANRHNPRQATTGRLRWPLYYQASLK